uniref:DUF4281 domain-containing protein n=1 Tax=Tetraselmis chuii TaxID=63592 RepID=A0A7S1SZK6_9CHLO|mmetsp:Transcript_36901/g.66072  ORF Transcript_36901/g.66072 Transcript_36901/m.66072 type:complete len:252 (+) Transcript_36901:286-1041(+)
MIQSGLSVVNSIVRVSNRKVLTTSRASSWRRPNNCASKHTAGVRAFLCSEGRPGRPCLQMRERLEFSGSVPLQSRNKTGGSRSYRRGAAAVVSAFSPTQVFTVATVLVMPVYTMMLAAPKSKITKMLVAPPTLFVIFAALYLTMLPQVAQVPNLLHGLFVHGTAMPHMGALGELFRHQSVVTLAWVHLLMLDLFQARWVLLDGIKNNLPTTHSVILSFMFGPTGLLSHMLTKNVINRIRSRNPPPNAPLSA